MLVDEFQDTDPIQWDIVRRAFGEPPATLVLIGDNCGGCAVGLFTRSVFGGPITKLVDKNDTSDAFPAGDNHFGGFPPDFRIGDGLVVFQNRQQVFAVPIGGGTVTPVAGPQDSGYSPPDGYCCIFADPSVKAGKVLLNVPSDTLVGVNLSGKKLERASLAGADLSGAVLKDTDFRNADLRGANQRLD